MTGAKSSAGEPAAVDLRSIQIGIEDIVPCISTNPITVAIRDARIKYPTAAQEDTATNTVKELHHERI